MPGRNRYPMLPKGWSEHKTNMYNLPAGSLPFLAYHPQLAIHEIECHISGLGAIHRFLKFNFSGRFNNSPFCNAWSTAWIWWTEYRTKGLIHMYYTELLPVQVTIQHMVRPNLDLYYPRVAGMQNQIAQNIMNSKIISEVNKLIVKTGYYPTEWIWGNKPQPGLLHRR